MNCATPSCWNVKQFRGQTYSCHCPSLISLPFSVGDSVIHIFVWRQNSWSVSLAVTPVTLTLLRTSPAQYIITTPLSTKTPRWHATCPLTPGDGGSHHLFSHSPATSFVWLFNFRIPCFLSADDAYNPCLVWTCGSWMHRMRRELGR